MCDHEVGVEDQVQVELEIESGEHDLEPEFKWHALDAEAANAFTAGGEPAQATQVTD